MRLLSVPQTVLGLSSRLARGALDVTLGAAVALRDRGRADDFASAERERAQRLREEAEKLQESRESQLDEDERMVADAVKKTRRDNGRRDDAGQLERLAAEQEKLDAEEAALRAKKEARRLKESASKAKRVRRDGGARKSGGGNTAPGT